MTPDQARQLLDAVRTGQTPVAEALKAFAAAPVEQLPFASIDTHRTLRK
ncbi:MAG: 1-(5-phosphoribosyl)-5-amino-4-imidazole-carboxylate carboxylase, partial [Verrucomicrobiales bacterium]|nr:1-(5-phosphoribosyl)-5-amino-4-imidazole-carboxylate carboxylase [Verrucomicrobiales bacterium]